MLDFESFERLFESVERLFGLGVLYLFMKERVLVKSYDSQHLSREKKRN